MTKLRYTLFELEKATNFLVENGAEYEVWAFEGNLGAGKTTLIKAVCHQMGVTDAMSSPTFGIVNEYSTPTGALLYHFDFYRLNSPEEAFNIGVTEYLDSGNFCFIEWPDRVIQFLPDKYLKININLVDENTRELTLVPNG
jgi:tRNA threonylcarbamoyladenosine biosynthesis protein TsaE